MLAYLRKGETFEELPAGFGIGRTTAWRYANEVVELLAARAPKLRQAVRDAKRAGHAYVILDGTLIPIDRVAANRPSYSGKHKKHGMNLQVIASPDGDILWVSGALPGSVHDKKAEWIWGVLDELQRQGLITLADKGYQGSTRAKVPYRGKNKPEPRKEANRAHARLRAPGERAAQDLEDPPEAALLPVARRETRQSHPRIAAPRGITRLETAQSACPPTSLSAAVYHSSFLWRLGVARSSDRSSRSSLRIMPRSSLDSSILKAKAERATRKSGSRSRESSTSVLKPEAGTDRSMNAGSAQRVISLLSISILRSVRTPIGRARAMPPL